MRRVGHGEPERGPDQRRRADLAGRDDLGQPQRPRMEAVHERLHQPDAVLPGRREHRLGLGPGHPERLLAEHVLAGPGGGDRPLRVRPVGRADVHGLDLASASSCSYDPYARGTPNCRAVASARSRARLPTATACSVADPANPVRNDREIRPGPRIPQRMRRSAQSVPSTAAGLPRGVQDRTVGDGALHHGQRDRAQLVVLDGGAEEADRAAVEQHRRARRGQLVPLAGQVQQHQPARRPAEVVHPGDRLLAAVAALVQVHRGADPADLVRDRAVVGLEAEPRAPAPRPAAPRTPRCRPAPPRRRSAGRRPRPATARGTSRSTSCSPGTPGEAAAVRAGRPPRASGAGSPAAVSTAAASGPATVSTASSAVASRGSTRSRNRIESR